MGKLGIREESFRYFALTDDKLRQMWRSFQQASGLDKYDFLESVRGLANHLDGRCPDGCCGGEGEMWKPTPAEWVALAHNAMLDHLMK